jgi:hypothetical protein
MNKEKNVLYERKLMMRSWWELRIQQWQRACQMHTTKTNKKEGRREGQNEREKEEGKREGGLL